MGSVQQNSAGSELNVQRFPARNGKLYLAVFVSNIGAFCFGISVGWTAAAEMPILNENEYGFTPTQHQWTWVCSILTLGAASWCLPMGLLMNYRGSKTVIIFQLLPYTIGWCLIVFARNLIWLYCGRFFLGMCGGGLCVAVPVYSVEVSQLHQRGAMGCIFHGACICGVIFSYVQGEFLNLAIANCINLSFLLLCFLVLFIPESPVFYARMGNVEKAEASLIWLRGKDYDPKQEMRLLSVEGTRSSTSLAPLFWTRLKRKQTRRSLCRASILLILEKLSGGIVFTMFVPHVLIHLGRPPMWIILTFVFQILGFALCFFLVDRVGRRPLFLGSSCLCFFSALLLGLIFERSNYSDSISAIGLLVMAIFIGAYSTGLGPLAWLINVEIVAPRMRPFICSITATLNWLTAFLLIKWYATSYHYFGPPKVFFLFAIVSLFTCTFTLLFLPETKGLTTSQIMKKMKRVLNRQPIATIRSSSEYSSS